MTDCLFALDPAGYWRCTACGWRYALPADRPPRRECPTLSDRPRQSRLEVVLTRYDAQQLTEPPREELARRLAVCEACPDYAGYACITLGSACRRPERWWERVLLGSCERLDGEVASC